MRSPFSNIAALRNNKPPARVVRDRAGMPINLADGGPVKAKSKPMSKSQKSVAAKSKAYKAKSRGKSC
jgi:hypothetical protein